MQLIVCIRTQVGRPGSIRCKTTSLTQVNEVIVITFRSVNNASSAITPMNTVAVIGSNAMFACEFSGAQGNQITWYFGLPLDTSNIIVSSCNAITARPPYSARRDGAVCHLDIPIVTPALAGVYTCRVPSLGLNSSAQLVVIGKKLARFYLWALHNKITLNKLIK